MTLNTPYIDLVPRPSSDEFEALKADIDANGILTPVLVDDDENILDGHSRYAINPDPPTKKLRGVKDMTDAEKCAVVVRMATNRRNLSAEQRDELRKTQQRIAADLAEETNGDGQPRWSQAEIGTKLGVDRTTITKWLDISDVNDHNPYTPAPEAPPEPAESQPKKRPRKKKRVKLDDDDKAAIVAMRDSGKTQAAIAAEFKITQVRVSQILKAAAKKSAESLAEQEAENAVSGEQAWVVTDSQLVILCDALITDPPYGILAEEWEPDQLQTFTKEWLLRWNKCGADLVAIFWSQRFLWDGKKWFDSCLRDYTFQQLLVWSYPNNKSPQSRMGFKQTWEPIFLYRKHGSEKQILVPGTEWGDGLTDFDCHSAAVPQTNFNAPDRKVHPAQKPVSVMKWLVGCLTRTGDLVADPFCGSGTTGIASVSLGRRFHGIELSDEFRSSACKRIAKYGCQ